MRGQNYSLTRVVGPQEGREFRASLSKMKTSGKVVEALSSFSPAATAEFAKAIQICGQLQDYAGVLQIWHLARERGIQFSTETYGILISALGKTSRGKSDQELSNVLEAGKSAWAWMLHEGHSPGRPLFGAALSLCAKAGEPNWARELWAKVEQSDLEPTVFEWTPYLEALALHDAQQGWASVAAALKDAPRQGWRPSEVTLAALTNAAAKQYNVKMVEWLWENLASQMNLNAVVFCTRSKAYLLGMMPELVPPLRTEMNEKCIPCCFRNFTHEAQAWLLLFHKSPDNHGLHCNLQNTTKAAYAWLEAQESKQDAPSRQELRQLKEIERIADRILQRAPVSLREVQVLGWPWQRSPGSESMTPDVDR